MSTGCSAAKGAGPDTIPQQSANLTKTQETSNVTEIRKQSKIDKDVQTNVPMINTYVIKALGASSTRLKNATPGVYGSFINIKTGS